MPSRCCAKQVSGRRDGGGLAYNNAAGWNINTGGGRYLQPGLRRRGGAKHGHLLARLKDEMDDGAAYRRRPLPVYRRRYLRRGQQYPDGRTAASRGGR